MANESQPQVELGCHVEVELLGEQGSIERLDFEVVAEEVANFDRGLLGADTPLAKAIEGQTEGSVVPYDQADVRRVRIVRISPGEFPPHLGDPADPRPEALDKAREQALLNNADLFNRDETGFKD